MKNSKLILLFGLLATLIVTSVDAATSRVKEPVVRVKYTVGPNDVAGGTPFEGDHNFTFYDDGTFDSDAGFSGTYDAKTTTENDDLIGAKFHHSLSWTHVGAHRTFKGEFTFSYDAVIGAYFSGSGSIESTGHRRGDSNTHSKGSIEAAIPNQST